MMSSTSTFITIIAKMTAEGGDEHAAVQRRRAHPLTVRKRWYLHYHHSKDDSSPRYTMPLCKRIMTVAKEISID